MGEDPSILHADLDAFYASVEQLLDPSLRGRPVAVGGGVVLAASYEAKRFGVSGGMAGRQARERCPDLVFVTGHFKEYQRLSERVMAILGDFTPAVQRISIDEAFLDVAGSRRLFGPPATIAAGDPVPGARRGRPADLRGRGPHQAPGEDRVAGRQARRAGGGRRPTGSASSSIPSRCGWCGASGRRRSVASPSGASPPSGSWRARPPTRSRACWAAGRGRSCGPSPGTTTSARCVPVGGSSRSARSPRSPERRRPPTSCTRCSAISPIASPGACGPRDRAGRTVTVRVRFAGMRSVTRSSTVADPVASTLTLREVAESLVAQALADHPGERTVTLLAISVSEPRWTSRPCSSSCPWRGDDPHRLGSPTGAARLAVDHSVDSVRKRFGRSAVGYAAVALSKRGLVPDEFRELAEHED